MKMILKLLTLVKSFVFVIFLAVLNGVVGHLSAILISVFASLAIVKFLGVQIAMSYGLIVGIMVGLGVLRGVLRYFEQYSNHFIAFKILARIRHVIFAKIRQLSPAFLDGHDSGDIISQVTSDTETLEVFYAHTISPILIALFVNGGLVVFVSVFANVYLGLVLLVAYLFVGILLPFVYYALSKKSGMAYRQSLGNFNTYFLDEVKGAKDIAFTNNQQNALQECLQKTCALQTLSAKNTKRFAVVRGVVDFSILAFALVMVVVGMLLVQNGMDARLIIVGVVTLLSSFGPITALASLPSNLNQTFASAKRLFKLLEEKPSVPEVVDKNNFSFESLSINNLSFGYGNKQILKDVNLQVNKGDFVGIVGPSGCGKSTLLKLILGFYNYSGDICFNGIDKKQINTSSLYDNVVMFSQSTYLFNDTIRNNMLVGKQDATDDQIVEALKKASIYDFVASLPNGLDEVISENSTNLSLGQKQRLGLARVLLAKPKLFLLDEATSNIDAINEGIILSSLKKEKQNMTVIMISHKKSTLKLSDKLFEMKEGVLHAV